MLKYKVTKHGIYDEKGFYLISPDNSLYYYLKGFKRCCKCKTLIKEHGGQIFAGVYCRTCWSDPDVQFENKNKTREL